MMLEGPSIKDQMCQGSTQAALSIAQIMKYNSVKHMRKQSETRLFVRPGVHKRKERPTSVTILYPKSTYLKYTLFGICDHSKVSAVQVPCMLPIAVATALKPYYDNKSQIRYI